MHELGNNKSKVKRRKSFILSDSSTSESSDNESSETESSDPESSESESTDSEWSGSKPQPIVVTSTEPGQKKFTYRFKCDYCPDTLSNINALQYHERTHLLLSPYYCTKCSESFRQQVNAKRHCESNHPSSKYDRCIEERNDLLEYEEKLNQGRIYKKVWTEMTEVASKKYVYLCIYKDEKDSSRKCHQCFDTEREIDAHLSEVHFKANDPEACLTVPTDRTKFFVFTRVIVNRFSNRAERSSIDQCDSSALSKQSISLLTSPKIMLSKPFTCAFRDCAKQLPSLIKWKIHVREHLGIRPFSCTWKARKCQYSSSSKSEVYTHVRVRHFEKLTPLFLDILNEQTKRRKIMKSVKTNEAILDCLLPQQDIYEPWLLKYANNDNDDSSMSE